MFGLKALLAILYFGYLSATQVCPPPEDIQPCSCFGTTYILTAHCNGVSSLDQLKNSVKGFQGTKLYTFTISSSSVEYLPSNIFENLTIQHLSISKSSMSRIANLGDPQFKGLERSLQSLTITETFTRNHPFAYVFMDHLKALMTVDLRKNHVEVLHNEWFKNGLPDLRILRFVECQIRRVGYRALQKLHNLRILDLSDNMINYIPRTALPQPATSLEELNLERNDFHSLPEDLFSDMPSLRIVNLELNELTTIDQPTWGSVWDHLENLNIDYNPLVCDVKIKWLYESKEDLETKLVALCYKPFKLFERPLSSLTLQDFE